MESTPSRVPRVFLLPWPVLCVLMLGPWGVRFHNKGAGARGCSQTVPEITGPPRSGEAVGGSRFRDLRSSQRVRLCASRPPSPWGPGGVTVQAAHLRCPPHLPATVHVCMHALTQAQAHAHMCARTCVHMRAQAHTCRRARHVSTHMHRHTGTCTHGEEPDQQLHYSLRDPEQRTQLDCAQVPAHGDQGRKLVFPATVFAELSSVATDTKCDAEWRN